MRKNKKLFAAAAVALSIIGALAGCGKKEETPETKTEEYAYVPQYIDTDIGNSYVYAATAAGDYLFICAQKGDEVTGTVDTTLYKYDIQSDAMEKLSVAADEESSVSNMAVGADGEVYMTVNRYSYEEDENGEITDYNQTLELWDVSAEDGSIKSVNDITALMGGDEEEYVYVQSFCMDGQGNFYLYDGDQEIHIINKDYQKLCDINAGTWINNMAASKEGDVYITSYGDIGMELRKVDLTAKAVGNPVEGAIAGYNSQSFYTGAEKSFLITNSDQVSRLDIATSEKEDLFKWLDMDVNSDSIRYAGELPDGRVWALLNDYRGEESVNELVFVAKKPASEVPVKEEIVFGTLWIDYDIKRNIIDFNKKSEKYRVTVKEYANDDYDAGLTQFNADLTTANCPDIISLTTIDYNQYVSKGVLEDLYPYMEKSGFSKSDFVENVLEAYEADGKLYGIMSKFYIDTTMAKKSLVGDKTGWTLSEMLDFADSKNAENIFGYGTRSSIFYYCIYNNIDEFVDWETGKCSFDSEDFIRVLEFAAKFPEEYTRDEEEEGTSARLRSEKILLMQNTVTSVQEYQMLVGMFGEPIAFVGYPNSERQGNLIQTSGGCMGMSAKSEKKEGAWEFMQTILTEEYQNTLVSEHGNSGFPVRKSALEAQFKLDMTPDYYEDENGVQVESAKTHWGWDDFDMEIMAATEEEVDAVRALIASASRTSTSMGIDSQLNSIITEESEAFFKGQKSAADVAGVIQNRIQIYVNESR
ncbi:MAG: extracellular solute-binding protein [Clostridium sp.]|nr:extracellular solute-binding protein [Clostridium sp.]